MDGICNIPDSCSDSDGGWNVNLQGTAAGYFNQQYYNNTDFCIDSITLKEFYCNGYKVYGTTENCLAYNMTSCSSGACV